VALIDYAIIAAYFAIVIGLGFWYQKRASKDLESYFLGGKRLHWLALAMSGSVSNFDITGTMWIVTLIALFGLKSMWNHWMWGFLMGAFFLAYMGKWVRRSKVMTGAEWMLTRFGPGPAGRTARLAYALMAVVTMVAFIAYSFQGIGKFTAIYVDADPKTCAAVIFAATTLYVLLGGLYSVVITDVIQTVILTVAAVVVAAIGYAQVSPDLLARLHAGDWGSLAPVWRLPHPEALPAAYAGYEFFGALVLLWVVKGLLLNLGGPAQMYDFQRFLAARDPRDAAKVGAAWSLFLIVRWGMAMGMALLALGLAAEVTDPEQFMPKVLQTYLPAGLRGLVIAGLLAAFMSTFSSTINSGASYLVRDLWQPLVGPHADERRLVTAGYVATLAIVAAGTVIGWKVESIGQIFSWIMMVLGAAFAIPNVLRWYWWRMNGWGYAIGTLAGLAGAIVAAVLPTPLPLYVSFPGVSALSLAGCLAGTLLTGPTAAPVLAAFYRDVRPFGFWGPVRRAAAATSTDAAAASAASAGAAGDAPSAGNGAGVTRGAGDSGAAGAGEIAGGEAAAVRSESPLLALANVVLGGVAILGLYLFPMYLVGHWHGRAAVCLAVAAAAAAVMVFTWYRRLPPPEPQG